MKGERPSPWGWTEARVRFQFSLFKDEEARIKAVIALIEEAGFKSRVAGMDEAACEIRTAGADSQWVEVIEDAIQRAMKGRLVAPTKSEDVPAMAKALKVAMGFARECRQNFDCDDGAHTYGTLCRSCEADRAIAEIDSILAETMK